MTIDTAVSYTGHENRHTRRLSGLSPKPHRYPAKITVNHWQLRDLVQPSSRDTNEILYTYNDSIKITDRATEKVSTACKLDFHPRCFKEAHDKIVTGGVISSVNSNNSNNFMNRAFTELGDGQTGEGTTWRGLFSFYNRETRESMAIRLGAYINNNASINKIANSQYSSFVCNNDMTLYNTVISNSSIVVNASVDLKFPLNHSALSDDQKNLVVVGDSSNIVLLHPGQQDSSVLHCDQIIETPCDSGFSTSFDPSGLQFASCFQDGTCLIYDIRNIGAGPVKRIYSTRRNSSSGAFRCVKYSRGTDDLLILSEHVGRVHVIDTRDFNSRQVIVFPMNTIQSRSRASTSSLMGQAPQSAEEKEAAEFNHNLVTPRVMEYNEILQAEGSLDAANCQTSSFYASRNVNNYNLLMSQDSDVLYDTDDESNAHSDLRENRDSSTSFTSSMGSHLEYGYSDNEICGVDWFEDRDGSHIVVGYEKGLLTWDIDTWSRRTFPSFNML